MRQQTTTRGEGYTYMDKIIFISMDSLFPTLFWGNIISFLFLLSYHHTNKYITEKRLSLFLIIARLCYAFYYFVASGRGILPDLLSVNSGVVLMLTGYYFEARSVLIVIKEDSKTSKRYLLAMLVFLIVLFNTVEAVAPYGGIRIVTASMGVVAIMALPVVRMLLSRDASIYSKSFAVFHAVFLLLLLARVWYGFNNRDMGILTTNLIQSTTFLSLLLQLMVAMPFYTLIIKSYSDEALILMATTDRLTGTTNRHAFLDAASAIFNNSKRSAFPISVLFLDIDHFKNINDKYGHAFGDLVLKKMAAIIDKCLRKSDLSCRYGGEEFVMLLSHSDSAAALTVAERILNEIRLTRFDEQADFSFSACIGVCTTVPDSSYNFEDAVRFADEAMYRAKRSGRDQVMGISV
jgi:diguanylate cyclase (GGDEF)-like protein